MTGTIPFYATQGSVYIGQAYAGTFNTASHLASHLGKTTGTGDVVTADVKEISITGGDLDMGTIKLFGNNEAQDIKRVGLVTCQFTIVGKDRQWIQYLFGAGSALTGVLSGGYRVNGTEWIPGTAQQKAVVLAFHDGTNYMQLMLNKAIPSNVDTSVSADGQSVEQTVTFRCLMTDYHWEDNFTVS